MATIPETTDAPSGTSTPYVMAAGDVFLGRMSQNASDWIAVTLAAGQTYSFGTIGLGAAGSGVTDPFLRLRAGDGSALAQNDDGGPGLTAALAHTAATSGTYYIEARSVAGAAEGAYAVTVTAGAALALDTSLGAAVLYREGVTWSALPETGTTLTWGVRASGPAQDAIGGSAPFQVLSAAQIAAARMALGNFSDVANLVFEQIAPGGTTNDATILMGGYDSTTDGSGAYAYLPGARAAGDDSGDLWINNNWVSDTALPVGSYDYFVFLHELGHAMGLDHPGDYNAAPGVSITYANSAQFLQDSQQFTVMSYFEAQATEPAAPGSHADTLMLYDIHALQQMYGVNHATRAGNDTYGFGGAVGGAYDFAVNRDPLLCIWDGGGTDTLNLSGFGGVLRINLNAGAFSDVGGYRGNLSIALGVVIEHAVGGRGGDTMLGNAAANWLRGGPGADALHGAAGNDRLAGNLGADRFVFGQGDGRDRVVDFSLAQDRLSLSADLWGGAVLTTREVLSTYAAIRAGTLVLDFGLDELTLLNITSSAGLAALIDIT